MSSPLSNANILRLTATTAICILLAGCFSDEATEAYVAKCENATRASESSCKCAAETAKEILGPQWWKVTGLVLQGKQVEADTEMAKLGLAVTFSYMGKLASAQSIAERKCNIRNLSRM